MTHDAVGRGGAADEALDLTLLSVEHLLGLGAGDRGGTCGGTETPSSQHGPEPNVFASFNVFEILRFLYFVTLTFTFVI